MEIIQLINRFTPLRKAESCIFVIRHADKEFINKNIHNALSTNGLHNANKIGFMLHNFYPKIEKIKTSHIIRCVQTAESIAKGYSLNDPLHSIRIIQTPLLSHESFFISHIAQASNIFSTYSKNEIKLKLLNEEPLPGIRSLKEGTALMLTYLLKDLNVLKNPCFYITHKHILSFFASTITNGKIPYSNHFQYLDGFCIKKTLSNELYLYWNETAFDISIKAKNLLKTFNQCACVQ